MHETVDHCQAQVMLLLLRRRLSVFLPCQLPLLQLLLLIPALPLVVRLGVAWVALVTARGACAWLSCWWPPLVLLQCEPCQCRHVRLLLWWKV
jgi:hypothetical protein